MFEKLLVFGIGYVLGARAGRERLDELVQLGRKLAERDEVKMVVGLVQGVIEGQLNGYADHEDRLAA
ncbi:MAG TPA: hypothetical protein VI316_02080 [Candidatus Dormibacteraeota bacterium]